MIGRDVHGGMSQKIFGMPNILSIKPKLTNWTQNSCVSNSIKFAQFFPLYSTFITTRRQDRTCPVISRTSRCPVIKVQGASKQQVSATEVGQKITLIEFSSMCRIAGEKKTDNFGALLPI